MTTTFGIFSFVEYYFNPFTLRLHLPAMATAAHDERATITLEDLNKHNTKSDCWIAVHSKVWDITDFIGEHPGGPGGTSESALVLCTTANTPSVLLQVAGSNATSLFDQVHAPDIIEELPKEKFKGYLEEPSSDGPPTMATVEEETKPAATVARTLEAAAADNTIPPLETIISAPDFESAASRGMTHKTWAFYSSAATDLVTHRKNKELVRRIMLRPRILRNVLNVNYETSILGLKSSAPFFVSPAAMARLVHPDGELALSRAAANEGIIQCVRALHFDTGLRRITPLTTFLQISSNASYTLRSIVNAAPPSQPFFFQLYINSERHKTIEILRNARELGIKAIFVTVDAPVPGKREADEKAAQAGTVRSAISGGESSKDKKGSGLGRLMAQYIDKSLHWDDLAWIREASGVPIVLKGVQTAEDVRTAVEYGVDAVLLSNHGGRSLDG